MRVQRRHVATLSAFTAAAAVVWSLWSHTSIVPNQVSRQLTENLLRQHGLRLEMDGIDGTLAGTLALEHPRLVAIDDSSHVLLRAEVLQVQVRRPLRILRGEVLIATLRLDHPQLNLDYLPEFGRDTGARAVGSRGSPSTSWFCSKPASSAAASCWPKASRRGWASNRSRSKCGSSCMTGRGCWERTRSA